MRFNEAPPGQPVKVRGFVEEGFFPFGYGGHSCIGKNIAMLCTSISWAMLIGVHRVYRTPGYEKADFNTSKSKQILGFIEAQNGCHISLEHRPVDAALEVGAPDRILNESERKGIEYNQRVADEVNKYATGDRQRLVTMEEVAKHTSAETGYWLVIRDVVYDVTKWGKDHPGGADVLYRVAGRDVTRLFDITNHSTFADDEAERYQVGVLRVGASIHDKGGASKL